MAGIWETYIGEILMTMFVSMVPVIELRGAIPIGVGNGLEFQVALVAAIIGNMIPVPFIIFFIKKIFLWMREKSDNLNSLVIKFETKAAEKAKVVEKYEWFGLVILVAIPLPGTGAWTGALVAAMLNMRIKKAFPAIFLGVVIAGLIVTYITYGASLLLE